jgi:hypothetical protein
MAAINERQAELRGRSLRGVSLLQRPIVPFIERRDVPGLPIMELDVRQDYPLHVGTTRDGRGIEVWRMYVSDPGFWRLGGVGRPSENSWSGNDEVQVHRVFKYEKYGNRVVDIEDHFVTSRLDAIGFGIPVDIVGEIFPKPAKSWTVTFVETPNSWAAERYIFA